LLLRALKKALIAAKIGTLGFVMYVKYNSLPMNPLFTTLKAFLNALYIKKNIVKKSDYFSQSVV